MASSKLMASSSTSASSRNSDLRRNPLPKPDPIPKPEFRGFHEIRNHSSSNLELDASSNSLMTVDEFLKNVYGDSQSPDAATEEEEENTLLDDDQVAPVRKKTVDEVWREIVEGKTIEHQRIEPKEEAMDEMMTLEEFLVKAGAVDEVSVVQQPVEAEVKLEVGSRSGMFSFDSHYMTRQGSVESGGVMGYGEMERMGSVGSGRGKRGMETLLEPMDKAAQQRQRRMIKNRESAARSRERKQAYRVELESMAVRLEEENEQLMQEKVERTKERHKLLMEKVIPVVEKRRPAHKLRRICSAIW